MNRSVPLHLRGGAAALAIAAALLAPAVASADPPPAIASPWWQTGHAWCTNHDYNASTQRTANWITVQAPNIAYRPARGWATQYYRSVLKTWDARTNQWLADRSTGWSHSN